MTKSNALKFLYLTCICPVLFSTALAQNLTSNDEDVQVKSLNKAKIYFVGIGLEREQKISKQSTLYFGAAIEGVVPFFPQKPPNSSDILPVDYALNLAPLFYAGYKNYYNLARRNNLGKVTKNNSASFVGFEYSFINPILFNNNYTTKSVSSFSPVWGFQRKVSSNKVNANLEFIIGPSIQTDFHKTRASGFLRFGYSLIF